EPYYSRGRWWGLGFALADSGSSSELWPLARHPETTSQRSWPIYAHPLAGRGKVGSVVRLDRVERFEARLIFIARTERPRTAIARSRCIDALISKPTPYSSGSADSRQLLIDLI